MPPRRELGGLWIPLAQSYSDLPRYGLYELLHLLLSFLIAIVNLPRKLPQNMDYRKFLISCIRETRPAVNDLSTRRMAPNKEVVMAGTDCR